MSGFHQPPRDRDDYSPGPGEVQELIRRAEHHPMGKDFLLEGSLDAVAATFSVHAFAVEEARQHLRTPRDR